MLHLTVNTFYNAINDTSRPVIVMFYAKWCNKCAMMKPVAESIEEKYHSQINFCKVDVDESPSLASQYETEIVPSFLFWENGQLLASFSGIIVEDTFEQRIKKIFRNC